MFDWFKKREPESRGRIESPLVPVSSENIALEIFGRNESAAGVSVDSESALTIPAVSCAVNFIADTIASLPLSVYRRSVDGKSEKLTDGVQSVVHSFVNDEMTSYAWRKYSFFRTLLTGRSITFIERVGPKIINLWPLNPEKVDIFSKNGRRFYKSTSSGAIYESSEIIDIPFALKADGVTAINPVVVHRDTFGFAIAAKQYGSRFFADGGVPPFAFYGPFKTGDATIRASNDISGALKRNKDNKSSVIAVPNGHEIKNLGVDPEKAQMIDAMRFVIQEVSRIYNLPPAFLQDLSSGKYDNIEQQDLHLVKHTMMHWCVQVEQEMTLKMFGRNSDYFVKFNLDGLLRGDFKTRMEGYSTAIQNCVMTPNEARAFEDRDPDPYGDNLLVQGGTLPLKNQLEQTGGQNGN